jgi:hypothetical protein
MGFALGNMVARRNYMMSNVGDSYRDILADTQATFVESDEPDMDMLLDRIEEFAEEQYPEIGHFIDYAVNIEFSDQNSREAFRLGAIACYGIMSFEKHRASQRYQTRLAWDKYEQWRRSDPRYIWRLHELNKFLLRQTPERDRQKVVEESYLPKANRLQTV